MSTAGEAQPSQGPKGPAPRGMREADAPMECAAPPAQGGRMSTAGEAQPSQGPKGAAQGGRE
jgi:hypothetical protein